LLCKRSGIEKLRGLNPRDRKKWDSFVIYFHELGLEKIILCENDSR